MKYLSIVVLMAQSILPSIAGAQVPDGLKDCPKEVRDRLPEDIRETYRSLTLKGAAEVEVKATVSKIMGRAFGGPYLTFDSDDEDNEYQICIEDGEGANRVRYSLLYNQEDGKWILEARLRGSFPVGTSEKFGGWRDIVTQERMDGLPPGAHLMRRFRKTEDGWIQIEEGIDSGG